MLQDHSKDFQQFRALMGLAARNCWRDILAVMYMVIGGLIFALSFFVFASIIVIDGFSKLPKDMVIGLPAEILFNALYGGLGQTILVLVLIAILVMLFEYSLSFTTVCYYYDNKSWMIPNLINDTIDAISNHFRSQHEDNKASARKHRIFLENEILKIRTGFIEEPKKE